MKPVIICLLFMSLFFCAKSQDSTITLSRFENFISQPGKIIKTEMTIGGQYGPFKVLKYVATDVNTGTHIYAVKIDNNYLFDFPVALIDAKALYIDSADLDTFIITAESFLKASDNARPAVNTQFSYLLSTDIQLTSYYTKLSDYWSFSIDKIYQKLRTHVPGTSFDLNKKRFQQLINILREIK